MPFKVFEKIVSPQIIFLFFLTGALMVIGCSFLPDSRLSTTGGNEIHAEGISPKTVSDFHPSTPPSVLNHSQLYSGLLKRGKFSEVAILDGFKDALQETSITPIPVPAEPSKPKPAKHTSISTGNLSERISPTEGITSLDSDWHSQVGWTLVLDGNYTGAEAAYREAVRQNQRSAEAHLGLGIALMMQGDREGALLSYQEALTIQPDYPAALVHLGYVYTDGLNGDQDFGRARELFQLASRQGDPFALLALVDLKTRQAT